MEERLDDAIHVLRNHAEGQLIPGHDMTAMNSVAMPPMGPGYLRPTGHVDAFRPSGVHMPPMAERPTTSGLVDKPLSSEYKLLSWWFAIFSCGVGQ